MKPAWLSDSRWALVLAALLAWAWSDRALAVEAESGPMYLTDSHGASAVVHSFLELSAVDPAYDKYWRGC